MSLCFQSLTVQDGHGLKNPSCPMSCSCGIQWLPALLSSIHSIVVGQGQPLDSMLFVALQMLCHVPLKSSVGSKSAHLVLTGHTAACELELPPWNN